MFYDSYISIGIVLEHNEFLTGGFSIFMVNNVMESRYLVVDQTGYHFIAGIMRMSVMSIVIVITLPDTPRGHLTVGTSC